MILAGGEYLAGCERAVGTVPAPCPPLDTLSPSGFHPFRNIEFWTLFGLDHRFVHELSWMPAFAGMTGMGMTRNSLVIPAKAGIQGSDWNGRNDDQGPLFRRVHMKFHEMVFTIKTEHTIINNLLRSIDRSDYGNARKKIYILKQLLINHFLAEEFVFYPFVEKKIIGNDAHFLTMLAEKADDWDATKLLEEMASCHAIGSMVIALLAECMSADETAFHGLFAGAGDLIRGRTLFEETRLLKGIDISGIKLLRKADFVRLRIED
ncbi:MAG: hypothetical protein HQL87_12820 [Magnetococcales bacterium]|nr:hypothetical protein [Magnetococcales bacterium]